MESACIRFAIIYHLSYGFEFLRISNTNVQREPSEERYRTLNFYTMCFLCDNSSNTKNLLHLISKYRQTD